MTAELQKSRIPTEYLPGLAKANALDPVLTQKYLDHTLIGDPDADALIASLADFPREQGEQWIRTGIDLGLEELGDAPDAVRSFFAKAEQVPDWFDRKESLAGCRAFHRDSEMFIGAFVAGVLVQGFSSQISKSFSITGRVRDQGVRRLKANNRHLMEIMLPGGLQRHGEGWKLSIRLRLIHARIRLMLSKSEEWDTPGWGEPISAAHMGLATSVFSALLLRYAEMLGVRVSQEERESFMMIWRYSGQLMGVPDTLLFTNEQEALALQEIGFACEPEPGLEAIIMANGLINSAPLVAGITERGERERLVKYIYKVSRALLGPELSEQLNYPDFSTFGILPALRTKNRLIQLGQRISPAFASRNRARQFVQLMGVSLYDEDGIHYRMPQQLHAETDEEL